MSPFDVFKQDIAVRRQGGHYQGGEWQPGNITPFIIRASVQPAKGEDVMTLPENRRTAAVYKIFTETELRTAKEGAHNSDIILLNNEEYEIMAVSRWQNRIIPHYQALAVKRKP